MAEIKGLEKFAPKDFPGFISSTVFLGGCNFRCPYCHNAELVLSPEKLQTFPVDYFLTYLDSRKGWLEGVCFTGGEPLIHSDLEVLLSAVKKRDLLVKLDTNASYPERLEELMQDGLIDYVAVDIKTSPERYSEAVGVDVNFEDIQRSIDLIKDSGLRSMFRITAVPGLVDKEDIERIAHLLSGAELFQIQQFMPVNTLDPSYQKKRPYSQEELQSLAEVAEPFFSKIQIEGI